MAVRGRLERLRPTSVRARTTAAACLVLGSAFVLCGVVFSVLLHRHVINGVDDTTKGRAEDVAGLLEQGRLPQVLANPGEDDTLVQVVDARGRVIAASENIAGKPPVATFEPGDSEPEMKNIGRLPLPGGGTYRVAGLRAQSPDGPVTVYVGRTLEDVVHGLSAARTLLLAGLPILLVLVGSTTWVLAGRALLPVEAIRAEVADISASGLDRRVPVPGTDDEVARLAATMNAMLDRLEEAVHRQHRFVGDASHELQSPLATLRAELEVALAHPAAVDWVTTAGGLLDDVERQERLVRDLLFLARADEGAVLPPGQLVDLDDVVLGEVERIRARTTLRIDAAGVSAAPVRGRREDLTRVVRNLLENACRHARSVVRVEVASGLGQACLVVADDGPGVPAGERERIFERFARLDAGRSRQEGGTGLGLAIAREIVAAHSGTIVVEDTPGSNGAPAGARFLVRLPLEA